MIYLDNAASTAVHERVIEQMAQVMREQYGNPSSLHRQGRLAERTVRQARARVAALIGASPQEVLFTSGGTESDNMALRGIALGSEKRHIVTTSIEHDAVLEPCAALEREGFEVTYVDPDGSGMIDAQKIKGAITPDTCLVSVMLANNEVGTVQPVSEIASACSGLGVPIHTDAVQAAGKIPVCAGQLGVDLMSISSHKINGPKGVGALYVRRGTRLGAMVLGGGQEGGMRSGTENVAGIAGFGMACELAAKGMAESASRIAALRDRLVSKVCSQIPHAAYNGDAKSRLPHNAHFTFMGVSGEDLVIKLDEAGIAASTGSACSVRTQKASHVLEAMGFSHEQISGSLRLSLGTCNTAQEIDEAAQQLAQIVSGLRKVSPFKSKYGF